MCDNSVSGGYNRDIIYFLQSTKQNCISAFLRYTLIMSKRQGNEAEKTLAQNDNAETESIGTSIPKDSQAYIVSLLHLNNRAVERAMIVLYNNQTQDERSAGATKHHNGKGFNSYDAKTGTYYALWVLSGRKLTGFHLERARVMSLKYVGQLVQAAKEKAMLKVSTNY